MHIRVLTRREIRKAFREHHGKTKCEIASAVAAMFPELIWRLPRERKIYESEASGMTILRPGCRGRHILADRRERRFRTLNPITSPFASPANDV
jgi:hypothetical protein